MSEMKWYVIRCNNGWEKKVKKYFENEIEKYGLKDRISQILIPSHKEYYIKNNKKVARETNYFPGYILLEANMCGEFTGILKSTPGALNFLGTKGKAEPLRIDEVERILGKIDELKGNSTTLKNSFIVNENVVISDGPFANFNATIEEVNEEKNKLVVSVKIFGRKTPLTINFNQVVKT
jgi:transcriptional antiterminator NusG